MSFMLNAVQANITTNPKEYWHNLEQGFIDDAWENSTQIANDLYKQPEIGAPLNITDWEIQVAQHAPALDPTSNINFYRTEDQAVKFLFKNIDTRLTNGIYYHWNGNYWMSYYEYDDTTYQSYCVAVRCDNELKFKDPIGGAIKSWPCRVDNQATASKYKETDYIMTPNNNYICYVQRNSETERVFRLNRRFLIGGGGENNNLRPFKIIGLMNSHKDASHQTANILYLLMQLDEIDNRDDMINGVAYNGDTIVPESNGHIVLDPAFDFIKQGIQKKFTLQYIDDNGNEVPTSWSDVKPLFEPNVTVTSNYDSVLNRKYYTLIGNTIDTIADPEPAYHNGTIKVFMKRYDGAWLTPETGELIDIRIKSKIG